jgi:hypothetical protein
MKKTLLLMSVAWWSCGELAESPAKTEAPLMSCEVELPGAPERVASWASGVVVGLDDGSLLRGTGAGCDLHFERTEPVGALLDVDAVGNAYVKLGSAFQGEHFPDAFGDLVARVAPDGSVTRIVGAPRGIWGFGVSASGETMWVSACGPTGVLSTRDLSKVLAADPPWELGAAVLTDDQTYWTSRTERCTERGSVCTRVLLLVTAQGEQRLEMLPDTALASPLFSRCGRGLCVATGDGVQQLDPDGAPLRELHRAELGLADDDWLMSFGMTTRGLYVLSDGVSGRRLHFTP